MKTNTVEKEMYPILMIGKTSKNVILFSTRGGGTVVHATSNASLNAAKVGESRGDWDMRMFEPFNGQVILEN